LPSGVFAAGEGFDFSAVSQERCVRLEAISVREVVVECFTADQAAHATLAVLALEDHALCVGSLVLLVGESERTTIVDLSQ